MNETAEPDLNPYLPVPSSPPPLSVSSESRPGIAHTLVLGLLFLSLIIGTAVVVECVKYFAKLKIDDFDSLFIQQLVAWPLTIWVGLQWSGQRFREACPLRAFPLRMAPTIIIFSVGGCILLNAMANLIPMPEMLRKILTESFANANPRSLLLSMVLMAPIVEELFFRGLVLKGFLGRYSVAKAVWASSILFALFHLNPWQAVVALPLGFVYAWMYRRTGSLLSCMLGHITTNFTGVFLLTPLGGLLGYDAQTMKEMHQLPADMVILGLAITVTGGLVLWRQMRRLPLAPLQVSSLEQNICP